MRIAVNARSLILDQFDDTAWFTWETFSRLAPVHPRDEFLFLSDHPIDRRFLISPNITPVLIRPAINFPLARKIWFERRIPLMLKNLQASVFFSPDGWMPGKTWVKSCLIMAGSFDPHDPGTKPGSMEYVRFARSATRILAVSGSAGKHIIAATGIQENKITVIQAGVSQGFKQLNWEEREAVKQRFAGGREYFIYAGLLSKQSNILRLLKAFSLLKRKHQSNMRLVLAGEINGKSREILSALRSFHFREEVILTGNAPLETLQQLIGAAYCLVYPSFSAGYSISLAQAMRCGVPVAASATGSPREVGGDALLYFDPLDPKDMAEKMGMLYRDERLKGRLITAGLERSAGWTWEKAASNLWECLLGTAAS
ncbi:MAG TPA: glycosyltransferase family 1 protein [Chitinophagaceae bacterium]|nr:glycosyltransferase family 1 protein [Chitinophagaceae bacterium]